MAIIAIEVGDDKNRNFLFAPTQDTLRGTWRAENVAGRSAHQSVSGLPPVIPGQRIIVDTVKMTRAIIDPLNPSPDGSDDCRAIREAISRASAQSSGMIGSATRDNIVYDVSTPTEMKTWLFWMYQLMTTKSAHQVPGTTPMPSLEQIESVPGEIHIGQSNPYKSSDIVRENTTKARTAKTTSEA